LEEEVGQSAANTDALLQKLKEEHIVEIRDAALFDGTPMKIRQ
jgi:hypothetical protein